MADDELYAVSNEFVGDRNALLRVGHVVAEHNFDLFPVDTASGVDVRCSLFRTFLKLCAERSVGAGQRAANANNDIGIGIATKGNHSRQRHSRQKRLFHFVTPNF